MTQRMGAPKGNQNGKKGKEWSDALRKAVYRPSNEVNDEGQRKRRLEVIADKVATLAENGEMSAIKEVGERLDGKSPAYMEVSHSDITERTYEQLLEELRQELEGTGISPESLGISARDQVTH